MSWVMKQGMEGLKRPKRGVTEQICWKKSRSGSESCIIELAVLGYSIYGARYDCGSMLLS